MDMNSLTIKRALAVAAAAALLLTFGCGQAAAEEKIGGRQPRPRSLP